MLFRSHHKAEAPHEKHEEVVEEKQEEVKDSTKTVETPKVEKKDTLKAEQ